MSDVIQANIQMWRAKAAEGSITMEEMIEAIKAIRKERVNAQEVSTKSRATTAKKKAAAQPIDSDDLLSGLDSL